MNLKEQEIFKRVLARYKDQWDLNTYARSNYDSDLVAYHGYRNDSNYPLAYNESFMKVMPIIYTLMSQFMSQLYQSNNIVSVRPRKQENAQGAKAVEGVLNYQLECLNSIDTSGGSYMTMFKWLFNAVTFGKGIAKVYWRKEDRISPKRVAIPIPKFDQSGSVIGMETMDHISQEMQTVYDGPYVEILHNKTFVPHPQYKNIQEMPAVFVVYPKSIDEIKRKVDKGEYSRKNFREMGWASSSQASNQSMDSDERFAKGLEIAGGLTTAELEDPLKTPLVDIIEGYTKLILKDEPYEVGSGIKIKGKEEEVIVHIGNYKTLLSVQKNPYGTRPFFDIGCYIDPEMYWDIGMSRVSKGLQEQGSTLANLRMQNAMMLVNQMLRVDPNSDVPPEALVWKPFGIVPAEKDEVEPLVVPDYNSQVFQEQQAFYDSAIQDMTGMYDYNMGRTPDRQERVGTVQSIQSVGQARAKLMLMSWNHLGISPMLKYFMTLNTLHMPDGFEYRVTDMENNNFGQIFGKDIHSNYDYTAKFTSLEPALGKQARAERLVQMAGLWQNNPWINQYQVAKLLFELSDVYETQSLMKTPEQMQQEMQQQQQSQMMAEQAQQQFEAKGKLVVADNKFQHDMQLGNQEFGHDFKLGEQEFRHDLALEAIKGELDKELEGIKATKTNQKSD